MSLCAAKNSSIKQAPSRVLFLTCQNPLYAIHRFSVQISCVTVNIVSAGVLIGFRLSALEL